MFRLVFKNPVPSRVLRVMLLILLATACQPRSNRMAREINLILDSLKTIHAPDTRIVWWKPEVSLAGGSVSLEGEVGDVVAYRSILQSVMGKYPEIGFNLVLLPEEPAGRLVNGLVNVSVSQLRIEPTHRAELVTQALLGTPVRVLKEEDGWFLVQTPSLYHGWVDYAAIVRMSPFQLDSVQAADKVVYTEQYGMSFSKPDAGSLPVSDLVAGCLLVAGRQVSGFHEVIYPDGTTAWVKSVEAKDAAAIFAKDLIGEELVKTALKFNGIPYLWGGTSSKAVDCSGFTSMVYFMNGMILMRDANQQSWYGKVVTTDYESSGLAEGDLLFFGRKAAGSEQEKVSHVAIYIGNSAFIHASGTNGKVGINSMDENSADWLPEYRDIFIRAVRIAGEESFGFQPIKDNLFYREIISNSE